jgi:hypothetical protein
MPPKYAKAQALERKAQAQEVKDRRAAEDAERAEAATWEVGANSKAAMRQKELEDRHAEKVAKKAEASALLAQEESSVASGKKTKKKGKDDFDKLNEALAAIPMTKAQKEAAAAQKRREEAMKKEAEDKARKDAEREAAEEIRRKAAARGIVVDHGDSLMVENPNHLADDDEFEQVSGLDGAINLLSVSGPEDRHPERRQKAAYQAYYDRMLPQLKAEEPGLKLSQYKERIFNMWDKAPENPKNSVP